jgi:spore coat polysaccharide biosynthesis protein SpsF
MKILVIMQARMGSSRFANKIMMPVLGLPLLIRQAERILAATTPFDFVIATTTDADDEPIRKLCLNNGLACFSGHPYDLLDRHYQAALPTKPDVVVKIPSDCPLIDPAVIDKVLQFYLTNQQAYDYVSNLHPATYPDGNDIEVMSFAALETAWGLAKRNFEREHTTPYIWEHPQQFRIGNVEWETGLDYSMSHRFTIDYPEDYDFIKAVYEALWTPGRPVFSLTDILDLLDSQPRLYEINAKYCGVNWYRHHINELTTIAEHQTKQLEQQN